MTFGFVLTYTALSTLVYLLIFRAARRSGTYFGAWLGCVHWILTVVVLSFWPQIIDGHLPINSAVGTVELYLGSLVVHLMFGAVVGSLYAVGTHRALAYRHDPIGEASKRFSHSGKRR